MFKAIKKIFLVGGLTAIGHVFALLLYPISTRYLPSGEVVSIGLIDSTMMMIVGYLGFGLNATATRDMALSSDWRSVLLQVQRSRITVALICSVFGVVWLSIGLGRTEIGWLLVFSPVFSLNYDFALYSQGKPEWAAMVSILRQAVPLLLFLILVVIGIGGAEYYMLLMVVFVLISSWSVSRILDTGLLYWPIKSFYKAYLGALAVGLSGVILVFQRYGFLSVIDSRISSEEFVYLATSLKFLLFFVACKRMLIQIFYRQLLEKKYQLMLNVLCFVAVFFIGIICIYLPVEISELLFNDAGGSDFVRAISLVVFGLYFFAVSDATLLLMHRDNWMFISNIIVGGVFVLVLFFYNGILLSALDYLYFLAVIEFLLAVFYMVGVYYPSRISVHGVVK